MENKQSKAKVGLKWKKKRWFPIESPASFGSKIVGETLVEDSSVLKGKIMNANVMQLSGNIKKQNLVVGLIVNEVVNNVGKTSPIKFEMQTSSVKRLVRKETSNLEDSFCCVTKDEKKVRVKIIAVTRTKINSGVSKAIRRAIVSSIVREAKKFTFEEMIVSLTNFDFQKEVKKKADKAYPLKTFQIRYVGLERAAKAKVVEEVPEEVVEEEEEIVEESSEEKEAVVEA